MPVKTAVAVMPIPENAERRSRHHHLMQRIRNSENLPTLSTVALEVLKLAREDKVSLKDLAAIIEKDPVLTVKILRLVNSAFFAMPREIGSVHRAVIALGIRTTTLLTLGFSLSTAVGLPNKSEFDYPKYWKRSIIHAVAARSLAKLILPRLADEAFVSGLLADIGMVAAWQCVPELYEKVLRAPSRMTEPVHVLEERILGIHHGLIGEELLEHWSLPGVICRAIGAHHGDHWDGLGGEAHELAKLSFAASEVAGHLSGDRPPTDILLIRRQLCDRTGISAANSDALFQDLDRQVADTAALLAVPINTTVGSLFQTQATLRMAQLTHQMEAECTDLARREAASRHREEQLLEDRKAMIRVASTDYLTGLYNRTVYDRELRLALTRAARQQRYAALLFVDADHFKRVNDTYGHSAGDVALRGVAKVLSGIVRAIDVVVRFGGEEFAVISCHDTSTGAIALAERIRQAVEKEVFRYNDQVIPLTVSIGVAVWKGSRGGISESAFTEAADKVLYDAKHQGRNQVQAVSV
ncbi:MAG: GGDEF domain-containing protein [Planctomycetota bacterium]